MIVTCVACHSHLTALTKEGWLRSNNIPIPKLSSVLAQKAKGRERKRARGLEFLITYASSRSVSLGSTHN